MTHKNIRLYISLLVSLVSIGFSTNIYSPNRAGILTTTHERNTDNQFFKQYLKRNAEIDCDLIEEISIVWNNNFSVQTTVTQQMRDNWTVPVHFYQTPYNSFSFRYRLANQAKARVFISIDDDIIIWCDKLNKAFQIWKNNAVGDLGPLLGFFNACVNFNIQQGSMLQEGLKFYFQVQVGGSIIPRKLIDLYNSDLQQTLQANSIVSKMNNCDDMAINFVVQKYYPQLQPIYVNEIAGYMPHPPKAASSAGNFHGIREQCNKKFTNIFGFILQPFSQEQVAIQKDHWRMPRELYQQMILLASLPVEYQMSLQKLARLNGIPYDKVSKFVQQIEQVVDSKKQVKQYSVSLDLLNSFIQSIKYAGTVLKQESQNYQLFFYCGVGLGLNFMGIIVLVVNCFNYFKGKRELKKYLRKRQQRSAEYLSQEQSSM